MDLGNCILMLLGKNALGRYLSVWAKIDKQNKEILAVVKTMISAIRLDH